MGWQNGEGRCRCDDEIRSREVQNEETQEEASSIQRNAVGYWFVNVVIADMNARKTGTTIDQKEVHNFEIVLRNDTEGDAKNSTERMSEWKTRDLKLRWSQ